MTILHPKSRPLRQALKCKKPFSVAGDLYMSVLCWVLHHLLHTLLYNLPAALWLSDMPILLLARYRSMQEMVLVSKKVLTGNVTAAAVLASDFGFACCQSLFQQVTYLCVKLQGLQYAQSAVYCQHNCQQLMLCACHAVHALLLTSNQSSTRDKVAKKFAELLSEAVETVAVFSEPGWLLRLEGHVDDVSRMRKLHAELAQLAGIAGEAGVQILPGAVGVAGGQASRSFRSQYSQLDSTGVQEEEVSQPDWRDDTDVLRGRLLELGGVAGLQTDTDCLLLKDLCRPGLEDVAFLELVDLELQVRLCFW